MRRRPASRGAPRRSRTVAGLLGAGAHARCGSQLAVPPHLLAETERALLRSWMTLEHSPRTTAPGSCGGSEDNTAGAKCAGQCVGCAWTRSVSRRSLAPDHRGTTAMGYDRRTFLKQALGATGAGLAVPLLAACSPSAAPTSTAQRVPPGAPTVAPLAAKGVTRVSCGFASINPYQ